MTRRPSRVPTRRVALALSLMLLAGSLALPAVAENIDPGIIAPKTGDVFSVGDTLSLEADPGDETTVNWAVRIDDPSRNSSGTKAGNVDGFKDAFGLDGSSFTAEVDTSGWEPSDSYFFVFNWGDPSDDDTRQVVQFTIDPFNGFETDETAECQQGEDCSLSAGSVQQFSASTTTQAKDGETAQLGLRVPGAGEDPVRDAVSIACQELLGDDQRLAGEVAHLVPFGFAGGNFTVTNFIPKSVIKEDVNRGTDAFQICIAPTEAEADGYGAYFESEPPVIESTGLVGPFLLDDCGDASETACVESRERLPGADLEVTYRIPAVDPWMM